MKSSEYLSNAAVQCFARHDPNNNIELITEYTTIINAKYTLNVWSINAVN